MFVLALLLIVVLFVWVLALTQRTSKLAYQIEVLSAVVKAAEAKAVAVPVPAAPVRESTPAPVPFAANPPSTEAPMTATAEAAMTEAAPPPSPIASSPPASSPPASSPAASPPRAVRSRAPATPSALEPAWHLVKRNPFASAGIGMIVLGLGFLLSYMAVQGLLPPWLRIATVATIGLAMLVVGLRIERNRIDVGNHLQGGALAVEYLCVLWAYQGYGLLEPVAAFACLAVLSAAAFAWSFWKRRALFATIGLLGALLAPVIASTGGGTLAGLAVYALCVSALGVAAALRLGLPSLSSLALAGSTVLLGAAFVRLEAGGSLVFPAAAFFLLFFAAASAHLHAAPGADAGPIGLLAVTPFLALALLGAGDPGNRTIGLFAALMGAVYLASLVRCAPPLRTALASLGATLILLGTVVGLEGGARLITLIASSFALGLVAAERRHPVLKCAAWIYWMVGVGFAIDDRHVVALTLAAVAAWIVAWRSRPGPASALHVAFAPLALAAAVWVGDLDAPAIALLELACLHAAVTAVVGARLAWPTLALSGLWLVPAWLLAADHPDERIAGSAWTRVALMAAAALLTHERVSRLVLPMLEGGDPHRSRAVTAVLSAVTMLAIGLQVAVVVRQPMHDLPGGLASAVHIVLVGTFIVAALIQRAMSARPPFSIGAMAAVIVSWGVLCAFAVPPGARVEAIQWTSVIVFGIGFGLGRGAAVIVCGALVLTVLRTIAAMIDVDLASTLAVIVTRPMQPFVSAVWAVAGVAAVYHASRTARRPLWILGANALALLVLKMLFIDLAAFSVLAKVVVFVGVGVLFLAIGYLSPLPPAKAQGAPLPAA